MEKIGLALGMEVNTVNVKLYRARHCLKDKIERLLHHKVIVINIFLFADIIFGLYLLDGFLRKQMNTKK